MSTLATTDPKLLRPLLRERMDTCSDEESEAVRKALLLLEARRIADELGRELAADRREGKLTEEGIAESLATHRATHPYR